MIEYNLLAKNTEAVVLRKELLFIFKQCIQKMHIIKTKTLDLNSLNTATLLVF
jgi:hypothetical protein